jgi:hypothetical protein
MKLLSKKRINPHWIHTGVGGMIAGFYSGGCAISPTPLGLVACRPIQEYTTEELLAEILRRASKTMS